jgi:simple sugar transport system permease protein
LSSRLRRAVVDAGGALVFPLIAILISFLIGAVIIIATGNNPVAAYVALITGAFGSPSAIGRTLVNATPLVFTGLGVAVAFRAGLFNIGGEGQVFIGAITAAGLGVALGPLGLLATLICLLACILTGFLWGAIPGFSQGVLRGARGRHHDHAQLHRDKPGDVPGAEHLRGEGLVPGPTRCPRRFASRS